MSKKLRLPVFPVVYLFCALFLVLHVQAANKTVTVNSSSATTSAVSVTGTTEASAVIVQVRNANEEILGMESFAVIGGSFTGEVTDLTLTDGTTYKIYVADYEGGDFIVVEAVATAPTQEESEPATEKAQETTPAEETQETTPAEETNTSSSVTSSNSSSSTSTEKKTPVPEKHEYIVKRGDTLNKIAKKLGVTLGDLCVWNSFKNINLICPGQKIVYYLYADGSAAKVESNGNGVYIVQKGDYLYKIAKKLNTTVKVLASKNKFKNINVIHPGQKIYY
jgi:LysM repeat protein